MTHFICCPLMNGAHLTKAALKTFLAQDIGDVRVLFLDNCSTDNTRAWLHGLESDGLRVMYATSVRSVAESWNEMLAWVFKREDHALVVNNDVLLRPDTYRHLFSDGGIFVTAVGSAQPEIIEPPYADPDPEKKRPHPDFSCFLIRKECYNRVGPFDENFTGAYAEDSDYHVRMHRSGIVAESLELPFYHVGAGTIKNALPSHVRSIQKRADKNRALFKAKHGVEVGSPEYYALFGHSSPV